MTDLTRLGCLVNSRTASLWRIGVICARLARMRLLWEFLVVVVEEWKGWLTGSLPMAVIAVVALIHPDIAPLSHWVWVLLVFGAGFGTAVFRVWRNLKLDKLSLRQKIDEIGAGRP